MNTTINISLPKKLLQDARFAVKREGYSSLSEYVRASMRRNLYFEPGYTVNGFTPEFEEEVVRSAAEPEGDDVVLETKKDIKNYFLHLKKPSGKK